SSAAPAAARLGARTIQRWPVESFTTTTSKSVSECGLRSTSYTSSPGTATDASAASARGERGTEQPYDQTGASRMFHAADHQALRTRSVRQVAWACEATPARPAHH